MAKGIGSWLFCEQKSKLPPALHADLSGRTVVVLGANTGIGFETTQHLARMSPGRLIIGCRSETKGRDAAAKIQAKTGVKPELRLVDLGTFASVKAFSDGLKNVPIDILVINAGVMQMSYQTTANGWEENLQINHLSAALVAFLLLPNMVKAAEDHHNLSRVVFVGTGLHYMVDLKDVQSSPRIIEALSDRQYSESKPSVMANRYSITKLINLLFVRALAEHLPYNLPVLPIVVSPGYCVSDLRRHSSVGERVGLKVLDLIVGRTAEEGSRMLVFAAVGPDGKDGGHARAMRGGYLATLEIREPSDFVVSKEGHDAQEKIWAETIGVLRQVVPEVDEIVGTYMDK